jgi:menaquinone-dependent protoporphyrinogen oxidase
MSPRRILIIYGTRYGQTAKIAERIGNMITDQGHTVTLAKGDEVASDVSLANYDGVVVGASILFGHHQRYIERFVHRHRDKLNEMPSAFFSVSGSAASTNERARAVARRCVDEFLRTTGWRPRTVAVLGGAIAYSKYGAFTRLMLRFASRRSGDRSLRRDYEATDWTQVTRFADEILALLSEAADSPAYARSPGASSGA